ncbi:hypothetical protein DL770_004476 [Monosporascus sp. CRB-9-2]|nr:hypothetical protein DL770_004476 [Monosporascus sp. CRB-9-2]
MTGDNLPPESVASLSLSSKRLQDLLGRHYETLDPEEERGEFLRLLCRNAPCIYCGPRPPCPGRRIGRGCTNQQQGIFIVRQCRLMPEEGCTIVYRERLYPLHYLNFRFKHLLDPHPDTGMPPVVFRGARGIIHEDDVRLRDGGRMLCCVACNSDLRVDVRTDLPRFQPALAVVTSWHYLGPGTTPEDIVEDVRYGSEGLGEPLGVENVARLSGLVRVCVYVRNLEERVKPDALKSALTAVFSEYGNIIDIVIKTNLKAKGQAFVVFDKPESAHHAIEEIQGFELFEKPMQVALARTRSDATVKSTGNEQEFEQHQRRRLAEKERKKAAEAQEEQKRLKRPGAVPAAEANRPAKAARGPGLKPTGPAANAVVPDEYLPPNKILFVQNLPDDYDIEALTGIFGRFEGFREVRLVPGRKGIAFIEYEAEAGAITAKENTAGMALADGTKFMKVTYQRQ